MQSNVPLGTATSMMNVLHEDEDDDEGGGVVVDEYDHWQSLKLVYIDKMKEIDFRKSRMVRERERERERERAREKKMKHRLIVSLSLSLWKQTPPYRGFREIWWSALEIVPPLVLDDGLAWTYQTLPTPEIRMPYQTGYDDDDDDCVVSWKVIMVRKIL